MTQIIRQYLSRYINEELSPTSILKRNKQQSKKIQTYYQYIQMQKNKLLRKSGDPVLLLNNSDSLINSLLQILFHINPFLENFLTTKLNSQQKRKEQIGQDQIISKLKLQLGRMLYTKFSVTQSTQLANLLNSMINFDANFISLYTLLINSLREYSLKNNLNLEKIFVGKISEYHDEGEVIRQLYKIVNKIQMKFSYIELDRKFKSFSNAMEHLKLKINNEIKISSEISQGPLILTYIINHNNSTNDFVFPLRMNIDGREKRDELDQLQQKIVKLEKVLNKKEFSQHLEHLKKTLSFLQFQQYENIQDIQIGVQGMNCNFGIYEDQDSHENTKHRLQHYIKKLETQQQYLNNILIKTIQRRNQLYKYNKSKYTLFAVIIQQQSQKYSPIILIQKTWKKFGDKKIQTINEEDLKKIATINPVALFYCLAGMETQNTKKKVVPQLKQSTVLSDYMLTKKIDEVKIQRILKNYSQLSKQECQYFAYSFKKDENAFLSYFSDPVYYFISQNQIKKAELLCLLKFLKEPAFLEEASGLIQQNLQVKIPEVTMNLNKTYEQLTRIIKIALIYESNKQIEKALIILALNFEKSKKKQPVKTFYEQILVIFLLKSCFFLDLNLNLKNKTSMYLPEIIVSVNNLLPKSIFRNQIYENIKYSLSCIGQKMIDKSSINLSEIHKKEDIKTDHIILTKQFQNRFKLWINFYRSIKNTSKNISQEDRLTAEVILYVTYSK